MRDHNTKKKNNVVLHMSERRMPSVIRRATVRIYEETTSGRSPLDATMPQVTVKTALCLSCRNNKTGFDAVRTAFV